MFTKVFKYKDYNGKDKEASYTFSLERDEMLRLELGNYGGLEHTMKKLMREERPDKVLDLLENIVLGAVGELSPDGESFVKSKEFSERFRQTKVCHDLLFEMMSNEDALENFILGAIPAEMAQAAIEEREAEAAQAKPEAVMTDAAH